jgi:hypothetical protein
MYKKWNIAMTHQSNARRNNNASTLSDLATMMREWQWVGRQHRAAQDVGWCFGGRPQREKTPGGGASG